jgi:hypothetical protein
VVLDIAYASAALTCCYGDSKVCSRGVLLGVAFESPLSGVSRCGAPIARLDSSESAQDDPYTAVRRRRVKQFTGSA